MLCERETASAVYLLLDCNPFSGPIEGLFANGTIRMFSKCFHRLAADLCANAKLPSSGKEAKELCSTSSGAGLDLCDHERESTGYRCGEGLVVGRSNERTRLTVLCVRRKLKTEDRKRYER